MGSYGAPTSLFCLGPDPRNPSGPAVIRPHHKGRTYDCNRPDPSQLPRPCEEGAVHIWIPATDTDLISAQHFWRGGLETAGPGCYDVKHWPIYPALLIWFLWNFAPGRRALERHSATVVRQRFFGIFWPLFLAGSERLRDNRRITDAAHNQHSEPAVRAIATAS